MNQNFIFTRTIEQKIPHKFKQIALKKKLEIKTQINNKNTNSEQKSTKFSQISQNPLKHKFKKFHPKITRMFKYIINIARTSEIWFVMIVMDPFVRCWLRSLFLLRFDAC